LRLVRSPDAPKITMTHGPPGSPADLSLAVARVPSVSMGLILARRHVLDVPSKLVAHGGADLVGDVVLAARREPLIISGA
jgi:hypothetical protein